MAGKKQGRPRHVPQRTCVACRQKMDKRQLTRVVRTKDDGLVVDFSGKRAGRGAYLCSRPDCWDLALRTNLLDKALKGPIPAEEKAALAAYRPPVSNSEMA